MQALLNAIDKLFATSTAIAAAKFPKPISNDDTVDPEMLPYVVRRVITAPTQSAYGGVHHDGIAVRFRVVAVGEVAALAAAEIVDGAVNDNPLPLASGQCYDCRRLHAPIPLVISGSTYKNARKVQVTMTYLYSVRN